MYKTKRLNSFFYCQADDRVPIRNGVVADSVTNENGAPDVSRLDVDTEADHVECVEPAITASLLFFSQFIVTDAPAPIRCASIPTPPPNGCVWKVYRAQDG